MALMKFPDAAVPSWFNNILDDDFFNTSHRHFSDTNTTLPSVNIKENTDDYVVEMAVPGFNKKDVNIELENNTLTISSDKKAEKETDENEKFARKEFSYQSFCRTFTLPETVDDEKIAAKYDNGILYITIPKKEAAKPKPPKQIQIK
ncbi:MAG: Hsp20/alpha crystallin family protein [Bacteroidales bacterium]